MDNTLQVKNASETPKDWLDLKCDSILKKIKASSLDEGLAILRRAD